MRIFKNVQKYWIYAKCKNCENMGKYTIILDNSKNMGQLQKYENM